MEDCKKRYYWLKLKKDFFTDKRIKKLRKIAGGDTYTIIYLKMQLLSLQDEGILSFDNVEDTFEEEIALQIDEDVEDVRITIGYLFNSGLLNKLSDSNYELVEAKKCIGSETTSAEKMRNLRAKRRIESDQCLTMLQNVTKCYIEKEIEKEKDIEIDNKKKSKKEKYFENEEVNNIFIEFLGLRKKIKAVNSDRAIKTLVNKLNKYDDDIKFKMIEQSIVNSWKDVYELKNRKSDIEVPSWMNKKFEEEKMNDDELKFIEDFCK